MTPWPPAFLGVWPPAGDTQAQHLELGAPSQEASGQAGPRPCSVGVPKPAQSREPQPWAQGGHRTSWELRLFLLMRAQPFTVCKAFLRTRLTLTLGWACQRRCGRAPTVTPRPQGMPVIWRLHPRAPGGARDADPRPSCSLRGPQSRCRERVSPNPPDPDQPTQCVGGRLPSVPKWIAGPSPGKLASASQRDGSLGALKNPSLLQLAVLSPHL